ncbi:MAG TPA: S24 family peptidase [Chthoniobacteraceae bacterium]
MVDRVGSQRELARRIGVSGPTIIGWLAGSTPYESTFRKISEKTGVSLEWLRDGRGDDETELARMNAAASDNSPRAILKRARETAALSLTQLAHRIGREAGYLRALEDGSARISEATVELLCRELPALDKEALMSGSDQPALVREDGSEGTYGATPNLILPAGTKARYLPLLSWAQAGALGAGHVDDAYDYTGVLAFDVSDRKAFALEIRGDSMSPGINEGDRVIVCPGWEPRAGDTVVARTVDGDVYCKVLQRRVGEKFVLISENPKHGPIELSRDEVAWIYPVGQVTKIFRRD